MKPAPFRYVAAGSLDEALDHLARYGEDAKPIAGGQSLMPMLALRIVRPAVLIDINDVAGLGHVNTDDGQIRIGAMLRQDELGPLGRTPGRLALLGQALRHLGYVATRSRGTVGGSLAHADPAAELPVCMLALDAALAVRSQRSERSVPAEAFFTGALSTALEPDELLTEIGISGGAHEDGTGTSFLEIARRGGDFALVAVACVMRLEYDRIVHLRLAAGGAGDRPLRLRDVESALQGTKPSSDALDDAANAAQRAVEPMTDLHATAAYRRKMITVLTRRALDAAAAAARAGAQR